MTNKLLILQTHFSLISRNERIFRLPTTVRWFADRIVRKREPAKFHLSAPSENEGLPGKWFMEFITKKSFANREAAKLSSWDNRRSFWMQREYLLQAIQDVGFDLVLEEYDNLKPNIAECLLGGAYQAFLRGTFIGIKTDKPTNSAETRSGVT